MSGMVSRCTSSGFADSKRKKPRSDQDIAAVRAGTFVGTFQLLDNEEEHQMTRKWFRGRNVSGRKPPRAEVDLPVETQPNLSALPSLPIRHQPQSCLALDTVK